MAESPVQDKLYLLKLGELMLKGRNRDRFERQLITNLRRRLPQAGFDLEHGRLYLSCNNEQQQLCSILQGLFGIVGIAAVECSSFDDSSLQAKALLLVGKYLTQQPQQQRFKVAVRRVNKGCLTQHSYHYACMLGTALQQAHPQLKVDLNKPDWVLNVELRQQGWLYLEQWPAAGGLPYGISGRALLLLSGGIDSPVAGYMMAKRGLAFDMIYFDTPPYTDEQARVKVEQLAQRLAFFGDGQQKLCVFPFTQLQLEVKKRSPANAITLLSRALMVHLAAILAKEQGLQALISGESLAQVASQTLSNMHFTASTSELPMLRPLLGFDKQEIISLARRIGTYSTSILPFDDCCSLFAVDRPIINAKFKQATAMFEQLQLQALIEESLARVSWQDVPASWQQQSSTSNSLLKHWQPLAKIEGA